jgi:hypothetical protein
MRNHKSDISPFDRIRLADALIFWASVGASAVSLSVLLQVDQRSLQEVFQELRNHNGGG